MARDLNWRGLVFAVGGAPGGKRLLGGQGPCLLAVAAWTACSTSNAAWPGAGEWGPALYPPGWEPGGVAPLKGVIHPECFRSTQQLDR